MRIENENLKATLFFDSKQKEKKLTPFDRIVIHQKIAQRMNEGDEKMDLKYFGFKKRIQKIIEKYSDRKSILEYRDQCE